MPDQEQSQEQQQTPPQAQDTPTQELPKAVGAEDNYYKRQAEKAEKRIKELERASMSEVERIKAERDELAKERDTYRNEIHESKMRAKFEAVARAAGVIDTEVAFLLAKPNLQFTDEGKLMGADQFVTALKRDRPHLFANGGKLGSNGGKTKASASGPSVNEKMNQWIRSH